MALRIATLISSSSSIGNNTSTGAVTKERLCGGLMGKRVVQLSSARMNEVCAAVRFSVVAIQTSDWERPVLSVPEFHCRGILSA